MLAERMTYPNGWAANNFTATPAIDDHRRDVQLVSPYIFVDNGRERICGIPAGYRGPLCVNAMYQDSSDKWHLSTRSTVTISRDQLDELREKGEVTVPFWDKSITLRLTEVK